MRVCVCVHACVRARARVCVRVVLWCDMCMRVYVRVCVLEVKKKTLNEVS